MKIGFLLGAVGCLMVGGVMGDEQGWHAVLEEKVFEEDGENLRYRLGKFGEGEKRPLVVFLHGVGERGDDNAKQLKHGVKDLVAWCQEEEKSCFVLAPQCSTKGDEWWCHLDGKVLEKPMGLKRVRDASRSMGLLLALIDQMLASGEVDGDRVYLTGLSMGGYGTFDALSRRPELFAAAVPICGGGDPADVVRYKEVPLWVFHGAKDPVIPVDASRAMVAAMKEAGGEVKYHEYPEAGHDAWTATYRKGEVMEWMFAQNKSGE